MVADVDVVQRLLLSGLWGAVIGYERQSKQKSAGLRTHVLVCLGACLIMILSENLYLAVQGQTNADPARLAAQVVSGIGFLGAGSIMKDGLTIRGLTTAASLWVVAGVGLATGAGFHLGAVVTTVLSMITLSLFTRLEKHRFDGEAEGHYVYVESSSSGGSYRRAKPVYKLEVRSQEQSNIWPDLEQILADKNMDIQEVQCETRATLVPSSGTEFEQVAIILLKVEQPEELNGFMVQVSRIPGLKSIRKIL